MPLHAVVLHIDDDADTRLLFREIITAQMEGLTVRWLEAAGIDEAVAQHPAENVALVLLDHRLGADQGLNLVGRVKKQWNCPVWMLTGLCPEAIEERARACGVAGVLRKDALIEKGIDWRALLTAASEPRP